MVFMTYCKRRTVRAIWTVFYKPASGEAPRLARMELGLAVYYCRLSGGVWRIL
jgi:hypothetical protein